ncbi:hypothetical protein F5144DRAFT_402606 [Chaetomium tenue]|uniref:Uncharacterized protein n=1 Tax=Chaetomium tenue TaxID=1854479 RepID=A0ACB7NX50_9PEZI|nr:hypothetical protein F5144DRAFT_402606 [Chaetomium globosum]
MCVCQHPQCGDAPFPEGVFLCFSRPAVVTRREQKEISCSGHSYPTELFCRVRTAWMQTRLCRREDSTGLRGERGGGGGMDSVRGFGVSLGVLSLSRGWTLTYWAYFLCSHSFSLVHPTRLRLQIEQTAKSCCAVAAHIISRARNDWQKEEAASSSVFRTHPRLLRLRLFSVAGDVVSSRQELFQDPDSSVLVYDPKALTGLWSR